MRPDPIRRALGLGWRLEGGRLYAPGPALTPEEEAYIDAQWDGRPRPAPTPTPVALRVTTYGGVKDPSGVELEASAPLPHLPLAAALLEERRDENPEKSDSSPRYALCAFKTAEDGIRRRRRGLAHPSRLAVLDVDGGAEPASLARTRELMDASGIGYVLATTHSYKAGVSERHRIIVEIDRPGVLEKPDLVALERHLGLPDGYADGDAMNPSHIYLFPPKDAIIEMHPGRTVKASIFIAGRRRRADAERISVLRAKRMAGMSRGSGAGYMRKVLEGLASACEGERNAKLNKAAYSLGRIVSEGRLDRAEVEAALMDAAAGLKLPRSNAKATIASGLDAAKRRS